MTIILPPPFHQKQGPAAFLREAFISHIYPYGAGLYLLKVHDFDHHLQANIILETTEALDLSEEGGTYLVPTVSCHFSSINSEGLAKATGLSGYGQRALLFLFQLKILGNLFVFCEGQGAEKLIVTVDDDALDYLDVYSPFFASETPVIYENEERQTQVTIFTDFLTYEGLIGFTERLEQDFRKILWQEQSGNPHVREYVVRHACL